jgi:hypothetical protein
VSLIIYAYNMRPRAMTPHRLLSAVPLAVPLAIPLALALACGNAPNARAPGTLAVDAGAPASSGTAAEAGDAGAGGIALISAGDEPRRPLRYVFHKDAKERMALDMRMAIAVTLDDKSPPPVTMPLVRMNLAITPQQVTPSGDLVYAFGLDRVDVVPEASGNEAFVRAIDAEVKRLVGMKGEVEVTPRGDTVRATLEPPADASEQIQDVIDQFAATLRDMTVPFPEAPVGKGGRWSVTTPMHMKAFTAERTATYTLARIDGDRATLDVDVTLTAPPQQIETPRLKNAHVTLDALAAGGRGKAQIDLQRLVPVLDSDTSVDLRTSVEQSGQKHAMHMRTTIGTHVEPAR